MLEKLLLGSGTVSYFFQVLPTSLLAAAIFAALRSRQRRRIRSTPAREIALAVLVFYLAGLLSLVWTPTNFWSYIWFYLFNGYPGTVIGEMFTMNFNLTPSLLLYWKGELTGGAWVREMLGGNVLLFLPLGFLLPLTARQVNGKTILPVLFGSSLLIELIQPVIGRSFDVDDLLFNTLGGILGFAVYAVFRTLFPGLAARCRGVRR